MQVTQDQSILDNFNFDKIVREKALANGGDPDFLRSEAEIAQMRQQRAQAQAQAQQQQAQAHGAQIAQQLGSVNPQSAVGQQLQKGIQQS